jgi:hypothetical protein
VLASGYSSKFYRNKKPSAGGEAEINGRRIQKTEFRSQNIEERYMRDIDFSMAPG